MFLQILKKAAAECLRFVENKMEPARKRKANAAWDKYKDYKVKANKVVMLHGTGKGYADNPKYIAEALIKDGGWEIIWITERKRKSGVPKKIKTARYESAHSVYHMSTAKFWISDSRILFECRKKEGQLYIQTWHGGLGLKKAEKDAEDKINESYIRYAKKDSQMADLFLSNCSFLTNLYHSAWWYDGEVLEAGLPRNDIFFGAMKDKAEHIKRKIGIDADKKIMIYAPTFRNSYDLSVYNLDFERCRKALERRFGGEWIVLLRLHPNINYLSWEICKENVINVTSYPDAQEILLIGDVLITDYSSIMFDFPLLKKPCFLYASDYKEYIDERGLYFTRAELPYRFCENINQLEQEILEYDEHLYWDEVNSFMRRNGVIDCGKACDSLLAWMKKRREQK